MEPLNLTISTTQTTHFYRPMVCLEVFHLGGQWHPWHWVKWPMATLIADPCVVALPGGGTPFELLTFTGRTGSIFPKIPIDMCLPNAVCETCLHMPELGWQRPSAPNLVVWLPHYDNLNDNRVPECPTGTSSETGDFKGTSAQDFEFFRTTGLSKG